MSDILKAFCNSILDELASLTPEEIAAADSKTPPPEGVVLYPADEEIIRVSVLLKKLRYEREFLPPDLSDLFNEGTPADERERIKKELLDVQYKNGLLDAKRSILSGILKLNIARLHQEFQADPLAEFQRYQGWKIAFVVPPPEPARDFEEYFSRRTGGMWGAPIR